MPKGVEVFVDEGFAEITVPDKTLRGRVLNKILEHTPVALVEKDTRKGRFVVYRIPEGNARDAGLVDSKATDSAIPLKSDTGFAADLVDADPQIDGRGDSWGEYRTILPTVKDTAYGAVPTTGNNVHDGDVNFTDPQPSNGRISGPLRPNKPVAGSVPSKPAGASLTASELQARIRENTPNPVDYAPNHVARDERVPVAQATIAATVDRASSGPAEPLTGFGIGPNAGRVVEGQPGGDAGPTTTSAPDIVTEQHGEDRQIQAPSTTTAKKAPAKKAPAKKAPAKKAAPKTQGE